MKINDITSWEDWCQTFQNIETFKELIYEIFDQHNLEIDNIENTYPGTNAVFKVGKYIVKIFVPEDVKPWEEDDYILELQHALRTKNISNYTPKLYANGAVKKKFLWKYLVFEFIDGKHMNEVVNQLTYEEKQVVVKQLKQFLKEFNIKPSKSYDNRYIVKRIISGRRWDFLDKYVKKELFEKIESIDILDSVIVHGDITGDNVLYNKTGIVIIDFGDSCIAPYYYEFAPVIIDMFKLDGELIDLFFDGEIDDLIELVIKSILIHDFGGDIAFDLIKDYRITSLDDLLDSLHREIKNRIIFR